jgi:hypothetical protein
MSGTIKIKGGLPPEGESLCKTCRWVHMQRGFRESEEAIFCNFANLRAVRFKVAECSDFESRMIPQRWELEKVALLINVPEARKPTGFRAVAGFAAQAEDEEESVSSME